VLIDDSPLSIAAWAASVRSCVGAASALASSSRWCANLSALSARLAPLRDSYAGVDILDLLPLDIDFLARCSESMGYF
jgi:hypothetical protein